MREARKQKVYRTNTFIAELFYFKVIAHSHTNCYAEQAVKVKFSLYFAQGNLHTSSSKSDYQYKYLRLIKLCKKHPLQLMEMMQPLEQLIKDCLNFP